MKTFLIYHFSRDLGKLGVNLDGLSYILHDGLSESGIFAVDTADLIGGLLGEDSGNKRSLEKTCSLLQISTAYLHNAGNDAYVSAISMTCSL